LRNRTNSRGWDRRYRWRRNHWHVEGVITQLNTLALTRGTVPSPFRTSFGRFADYARWIANQHLSLAVWDREVVVQDMHLTLGAARFVNVEPHEVSIPALRDFVEDPARPVACSWGENLEVWLDSIRALPRRSDKLSVPGRIAQECR